MHKILIVSVKESSHRTNRMIEELRKRKVPFEFVRWKNLIFGNADVFVGKNKLNLKKFKAVFFDIPKYEVLFPKSKKGNISFDLSNEFCVLLHKCKKLGISAINRDFILENSHYNKFTLSQRYLEKGLSALPTFHFCDNTPETILDSMPALDLHFPIVAKQSHGSMGEQVWKIVSSRQLQKFLKSRRSENLIFQPFFKNNGDFRVLVANGKILGIMKRKAKKGEWRNNYSLGGKIKQHQDNQMSKFASRVAKKMNLDYVGIDLFQKGNSYYIIELNIFASFEGFEKACVDANVAKHLLNFLLK